MGKRFFVSLSKTHGVSSQHPGFGQMCRLVPLVRYRVQAEADAAEEGAAADQGAGGEEAAGGT